MNKKFLVILAIFLGISLFAGGFFASQAFAQTDRPTTWMMGDENNTYGPGMMANGQHGSGMMGGQYGGMMNGSGMMGMMGDENGGYGMGMMADGQYGPGMMGNQYGGIMNGSGMMGGEMMSDFINSSDEEAIISVDEAVTIAQEYLDTYLPGKTVGETADEFPGYYTLHILENGEITGMLSVNVYTGQVFLHHWHGDFIEMAGEDHD